MRARCSPKWRARGVRPGRARPVTGRNVSRTSHSACGPSSSANAERRPRDERRARAAHLGREHALGVEQARGLGRRPGGQLDGRRQRLGEAGVAKREVVVLDREDVREVRRQLDGQLDRQGVAGEVGDDDVLLQIVGHEALPADQQLVRTEPTGAGIAQEERGREVLDLAGRERHRWFAVDSQRKSREKSRVVRIESMCAFGDRAVVCANAKGRPVEDGEGHLLQHA